MKKKLMMVAVLLGALSLGACVDDNESASVTDLRGAKAEQLRAAAALDQAKADAEAVRAAAEAAYQEAMAEYYSAQAAQIDQQTQEAADRFAITVQELQAQLQLSLVNLQKQIQDAEQYLATSENTYLTTVFGTYKTELSTLNSLNSELMRAQADIAYLEAGVKYAEANAQVQITSYQRQIAGYNAQLEVLNDPAYTNMNRDELYAQYQAAQKKADLAWQEVRSNEGKALKDAGDAVKAAYEALEMDTINDLNNFAGQYGYYPIIEVTYGDVIRYATDIYGNYSTVSVPESFRINETNKLYLERSLAASVESASDALGTPSDTKDKATAYGRLALAKANLADANALADTIPGKAAAVAAAEEEVAQRTDDLNQIYVPNYNRAVANQDEYKALYAAVDLTGYETRCKAVFAADEKENAAQEAYDTACLEPTELSNETQAIWDLYSNATNINDQIAQVEANIAYAEQQIAFYQDTYVTDSEVALSEGEKKIEDLTEQIAIQEKIVAAAKATLDKAIANGDETPAEETPAA